MKNNTWLDGLTWNGMDDAWSQMFSDIFLAAVRAYVGWIFLRSGLLKVENWEQTISLFENEYQVPFLSPVVAAYLGTAGEVVFPTLIMMGLFTRWAALGLLAVNVIAVVSYPQLFELACPAAINDHKYWGVMIISLFVFGAGKLSFDYVLKQRKA